VLGSERPDCYVWGHQKSLNMKNIINYVCSISASLLILIFLEGLLTGGMAFKFELYGIVAWIAQIAITIFFISLAILITESDLEDKKRKKRSF
jgi:hypothetical protein